ncbi:MAG: bifunctional phosphopantothenoylcysteine decarboxylase/phosphopantothenate--cysteine ligase CoaBC, partial [Acidimicrobiia bacterium]|nr:bifunctional phosphopantothenoylcysteine decarboxylase/phosphopantothenate--cysteine ligase CoaBC [Acidimicrobiia bacterium]
SRGEWGEGRLAEPADVLDAIEAVLGGGYAPHSLDGLRLLVTAGGTREPIDAVRFVGNRSSGRMGFALASEAARRGAEVTVVAANVTLERESGIEYADVETAAELERATLSRARDADVVLMAAAVADFRPAQVAAAKIKKGVEEPPSIELVRNEDVLAGAVRARADGQLPNMRAIVGFAAETGDANGDVLFHARAKLRRKGCDLLVVNAVGEGKAFEVDNNDGWLLASDGTESALQHGSKTLMASRIVDAIVTFLHIGTR